MVKLNRHGWGLQEMILLSSILLAFLLIAFFMISRLYDNLSGIETTKEKESYTYEDVIDTLEEAALRYYDEYYEKGEEVVITSDRLRKHGYVSLSELKPKDEKSACSGYVEVKNKEAKAYIRCSNYESNGYEE